MSLTFNSACCLHIVMTTYMQKWSNTNKCNDMANYSWAYSSRRVPLKGELISATHKASY